MLKRMDCFGLTDIGRVRDANEDQFLIADLNKSMRVHATSLDLDAQTRLFGGSQGKLLLVADGMGGHASGERASSIAVDSVAQYILNAMHWIVQLDHDPEEQLVESLKSSLMHSQQRILDEARSLPDREGMGTTVTMAYLVWPKMYVAHVGDSRCYLLHRGSLKQITRDHNMAERMVEEGALARKEARNSRWQNVVWNVLGGPSEDLSPEVTSVDLQVGDSILLCSDGLTKHVTDEMILRSLSSCQPAKAVCEQLVRLANSDGGTDNTTVVVAHFRDGKAEALEETAETAKEKPKAVKEEASASELFDPDATLPRS